MTQNTYSTKIRMYEYDLYKKSNSILINVIELCKKLMIKYLDMHIHCNGIDVWLVYTNSSIFG